MSSFSAQLQAAELAEAAGRLDEAQRLYEAILAKKQYEPEASLRLGILFAKTRRVGQAIAQLQAVLEIDPVRFDALIWLAPLMRQTGEIDAAVELSRVAIQIEPENSGAHSVLGLCLLSQGAPELAEPSFRRAIELEPNEPILHHQLGECMVVLARNVEAETAFRNAIRLAPNEPNSYVALAQLFVSMGDRPTAATLYRQAFQSEPNTNRGLSNLAKALIEEGRPEEAIVVLEDLIKKAPRAAALYHLLGNALKQAGRMRESAASLKLAIDIQPKHYRAYYSLTYARRSEPEDRELIDRMSAILSEPRIPLDDRAYLEYAIGKSYDDLREYESAIRHFDEANLIMKRLTRNPFDRAAHSAGFDVAIKLSATLEPDRSKPSAAASKRACVVVGMIRSGTTLLEQILSSHPAITGAGELTFWLERSGDCLDPVRSSYNLKGAEKAGEDYLALLDHIDPNARIVIDKLPLNYQYLGLISIACPEIRILHCRRQPIDNCLSTYVTPYPGPVPYAHDRSDLAFYYREYRRLMDHWRQTIPADRFFEVDYEDLVLNREPVVRAAIDFLGLDWDPACLTPETNQRPVDTPSSWQVRQPVYNTSIGRWKNYEPWLGELRELQALYKTN